MLKKKLSRENSIEELVAAGREARAQGLLTEAIKHFQSALAIRVSSPDEEASVRCRLAETYEKAGLYAELLSTVSKYDSPTGLRQLSRLTGIEVLIQLGWAHSRNNDIPRAIALFNQALHSAQVDEFAIIAACHSGLGRAYGVYSEIQFARDHYTTAIEYHRRVGDLSRLAESYLDLSFVDIREGEYQEAFASISTALSLLSGSKDAFALGKAYERLGMASIYLDDFTALPSLFERSLESARQSGALALLVSAANNHAWTRIVMGDWARAEESAKYGLEIACQTSNPAYISNSQETLVQVILLQGRISEADGLLTKSLQLANSIPSGEWVEINIQISMGRSSLFKDEPDQAILHFRRALDICERMGNYQFRPDAQVWLSEALIRVGKLEEAKTLIQTTLFELRRSPNMEAWGYLTRVVAEVEFRSGHVEKAFESLKQSSSVFEIRGAVYARAVNRLVLAQMLEDLAHRSEAIYEVEAALAVFEKLGAVDAGRTKGYLDKLRKQHINELGISLSDKPSTSTQTRKSIIDYCVTERILDASFSRKLLLYELASISREHSSARAAGVVEVDKDRKPQVVASIGLNESEQQELLNSVSVPDIPKSRSPLAYEFCGGDGGMFILYLIDAMSENFVSGEIDIRSLLYLVENGLQKQFLKSQVRKRPAFDPSIILSEAEVSGFICKGPAMTKVLEQIHKIRSSNAAVLITGESGSGKELVARAVHAASTRKFGTFLPFNCSSVAREMVESQLFGYRKGSFTGAISDHEGVIRAAEHGTLFLDEIGEMPIDLQPKLLRFLQEGEIHPLGETKPLKIDVRLVAATNVDLEKEVAKGRFREDLFYRLNVIRVHVPPLRERREEIPALIAFYLKQYQQDEGKIDIALSQEAIDLMIVYDWPGNVRQLCNQLRRLVAYNESGSTLNADSLSSEIVGPGQVWFSRPEKSKTEADLSLVDSKQTLAEATDDLERNMIQAALRRSSGNIAQAAKELGLSRGGLYLKMNRLKLQA